MAETLGTEPLLVVSNRAPLSFDFDGGGELVARRGAGGLVSGLAPLVEGTPTVWVAAAITEGDRRIAGSLVTTEGFTVELLSFEVEKYRLAYDVIANATLWFLHHRLFDLARAPRFDMRWHQAWSAFREVNEGFARCASQLAPPGATVLLQDYHLSLAAKPLREARPDLTLVHFHHTPFCAPEDLEILPDGISEQLLEGLAANHACGFHTQRWADGFLRSCEKVLGHAPDTFTAPLSPDADAVAESASSPDCEAALSRLDAAVGDRLLIARVDRIELSKNLIRGFAAFDELLTLWPEWRERVVMVAFCYPSRLGVPEYRSYYEDVLREVASINRKWANPTWTPVIFDGEDNHPRSMAALRRYDVLLVNPVRDGMNLVALEGPLANERDGQLVLSTEAGAYEVLAGPADGVQPFDVSATAVALDGALRRSGAERADRAAALRGLAMKRTPREWLQSQLAAAATASRAAQRLREGPPAAPSSPQDRR